MWEGFKGWESGTPVLTRPQCYNGYFLWAEFSSCSFMSSLRFSISSIYRSLLLIDDDKLDNKKNICDMFYVLMLSVFKAECVLLIQYKFCMLTFEKD